MIPNLILLTATKATEKAIISDDTLYILGGIGFYIILIIVAFIIWEIGSNPSKTNRFL